MRRARRWGCRFQRCLRRALQTSLPVLWTWRAGDTNKDIAEGETLLAEGRHQAFKLKIGARELATDLRHTRRLSKPSAIGRAFVSMSTRPGRHCGGKRLS